MFALNAVAKNSSVDTLLKKTLGVNVTTTEFEHQPLQVSFSCLASMNSER